MNRARIAAATYLDAKAVVISAGFDDEIEWQWSRRVEGISEEEFLCEGAWVILSAGLSSRAVGARFPSVREAFGGFCSASEVWSARRKTRLAALAVFNSPPKVDAVLTLCGYVARAGIGVCIRRLRTDGVEFLQRFPFFGPATSRHLAKNLGIETAKPDRHLRRIANAYGYASPMELCSDIHTVVGDPIGVIDVVLWRYAALKPGRFRENGVVGRSPLHRQQVS